MGLLCKSMLNIYFIKRNRLIILLKIIYFRVNSQIRPGDISPENKKNINLVPKYGKSVTN